MEQETIQTILIVLTLLVAGYALFRKRETIDISTLTPSAVLEEINSARPIAVELMEIAQVAVNSVEQLRREGKIQSNDVAFNTALDLIKKWVPDQWELDNEDIVNSINAAVLVASALRREAGVSSENATNVRQSQ